MTCAGITQPQTQANNSQDKMADISHFPNLDQAEFAEACHLLDSRYRQATLGPLRRRWKLNVCTALATSFSHDNDGYTTYIQISRPLEGDVDLPFDLGTFSISGNAEQDLHGAQDAEMMETEESDKVRLSSLVNFDSFYLTILVFYIPSLTGYIACYSKPKRPSRYWLCDV